MWGKNLQDGCLQGTLGNLDCSLHSAKSTARNWLNFSCCRCSGMIGCWEGAVAREISFLLQSARTPHGARLVWWTAGLVPGTCLLSWWWGHHRGLWVDSVEGYASARTLKSSPVRLWWSVNLVLSGRLERSCCFCYFTSSTRIPSTAHSMHYFCRGTQSREQVILCECSWNWWWFFHCWRRFCKFVHMCLAGFCTKVAHDAIALGISVVSVQLLRARSFLNVYQYLGWHFFSCLVRLVFF